METAHETDTSSTEWSVGDLSERRRSLLRELVTADADHLNTAELRERTEVPRGSMPHHLRRLEEQGLVESAGMVDATDWGGGGKRPIQWRATADGEQLREQFTAGGADADDGRVEELEAQVETLTDEIEELQNRYDALADFVEEMADERA